MRVYKRLRNEAPVYYIEKYDTFFFSRFQDVQDLLSIGDNTLIASESPLPTPEYLMSRRNTGAPPMPSVNPMSAGPLLASPHYKQMRLAHIAPLRPKSRSIAADFHARARTREVALARQ